MKKTLIFCIIFGIVTTFSSGAIGYTISKKRYSPRKTSGEIYIDYTEDAKHPIMYLNNLDLETFSNKTKYIVLGVNHVRK